MWTYEGKDFLNNSVTISINTDDTEQNIVDPAITISRDPGCVYTHLHAILQTYNLPDGELIIPISDLHEANMYTLSDVLGSSFYLTK